MRKKSLALLLALVMLLSLAVPSALASEPEEAVPAEEATGQEPEKSEVLTIEEPQVVSGEFTTAAPRPSLMMANTLATRAGTFTTFGDQLSGNTYATAIYEALCDPDNLDALRNGDPVAVTLKSRTFTSAETGEISDFLSDGRSDMTSAAKDATAAFDRDRSDIFWTSGYDLTTFSTQNGSRIEGSYTVKAGTYTVGVEITLPISVSWTSGERSITADERTVDAAIDEVIFTIPAGADRYTQLKTVHDWLTENNAYNSAAASAGSGLDGTPWEAISALTNDDGLQPVCEGYARAFKLICDRLDIPCVLVSGVAINSGGSGAHMWNYVQMDDGNWYAVDVTWDDPTVSGVSGNVSGYERDTYFLVGSNTPVDGTATFAENHTAHNNDFITSGHYAFSYPDLETERYEQKPPITGSVTISGTAKYGETLTATVKDAPDTTIFYQWYRGKEEIQNSNSNIYTLTAEDVGKKITVEVTALGYTGSLTATAGPVEKANGPAEPTGVEVVSVTHDSITVTANDTWEYACDYTDEESWQKSNIFTDLSSDMDYIIYVRVKETATHKASGWVSVSARTTINPVFSYASVELPAPQTGKPLATVDSCTFYLGGYASYAEEYIAEKKVEWYVEDESGELMPAAGTIAQPSTRYAVQITITLKAGYTFSANTLASVNDKSMGVSRTVSDGGKTLTIEYTFPATAAREIASFTVSADPNPVDVPTKDNTVEVLLTATVTYADDPGTPVDVTEETTWTPGGNNGGTEIVRTNDGWALRVSPEAGSYDSSVGLCVNASFGGQTTTLTVTLSQKTAQVTDFQVDGPASIAIPGSGSNTAQYIIKDIYDQYGASMPSAQVQWSISNVTGVSVNEDTGVVTVTNQAAAGTATLTATCGSVYKDFSIDIRSKENAEVTITGVPDVPKDVVKGDSFQLNANVDGFDPDASRQWTSSNEDVLSIINSGTEGVFDDSIQAYVLLKAVGSGTATITFTCEDDTRYGQDSVTITVLKQPALSDFTYTLPSGVVYDGQEHPVTVTPKDGITGMGSYQVLYNDSETVPVDAGSYTVTLRVEKGTLYTAATFPLGTLTIDKATPTITVNDSLTMVKGTSQSLGAAIDPDGLELTYKSSASGVATVDSSGTVTGVAVGTATITVSYAGDKNHESATATVTVTVTDKNQVTVDFAAKGNQTYKPDGYALGGQFSEATVEGGKAITKYIYDNTEYTSLSALPTVYNAGTYTVTAVYESDTEYGKATATFTINKANQAALTITSASTVTYGNTLSLTTSGGSGTGEVTFAVTDGTGKATVSGSTLTPTQAGTVTVTATKAGDNNYNPVTSAAVTITIEKAAYTGADTAAGSAKYGNSGTVDLSGLIVPGGAASVGTVTDSNGILNGAPAISGGELSFTLVNDSGNVGKTAVISVSVTSANYEGYTITVTVTVNDKAADTTTMKVSLTGWTYGQAANTPSVSGVSGGSAVYSYSGTGSTAYGPSATAPTAAGTYQVTATYENADTIYTASADFTIAKADPAIGTVSVSAPATIFTSTDPEAVTLSWTNTAITGTLKLADGTQFTSGTKSYTWVFSPADTANYNSVQGTIRLSVTANALQSIAVTAQPAKTAYQYGEAFDPAGMAVTATYADGSSKTVDNGRLTVRYASGSGFNAGDTSVTLSYTEDGVTKTCAVTGLTVSKIAYPGTTSAAGSAKYGSSGTVNLSAMIAPGGTLGTPAVTSGSDILSGTPTLSGGVLTFAFKDNADNVGKDAVITVPVTGAANYNDYTITVTVTVTDKLTPTVTVKDITVTYTGSPVPASAIRGTATYGGETVKGTWSWYGKSPTNVAESDLYLVCFTPEDSDTYATVVKLVNVTINKATPTGTPKYTAVTEDGKTLEDVALSASGFSVPGTVKWVDDEDTLVRANTAYQWTFTPADRANYNVVSGKLTPYRVYDDDDDTPVEGSIVSAPAASHGSVRVDTGRAEKGDTVTITAIPDEGYVLESIVVTDRYGDTVRLTNEGDGVFSFTMPGSAITVKTVFVPEGSATVSQEMDFADVGESHWAYNEIAWAFENGYMNGTGTATFHPTGSVTRQQVWMILARMSGADPANMAEAKNWAVNNGVSDGSNPGSPVTRQQLVALLYRFAGQMGYDTAARADLSGYPDAASVSSYAADAMAWSVANSIVGGTTAGTLNPTGTANRAQFAAILWRFYQSSQS